MKSTVVAFYKFVVLDDCAELAERLDGLCRAENIQGTILLAGEGINGTVAGPEEGIRALVDELRSDARFADIAWKYSSASGQPFRRLKIKIKPEIVRLDQSGVDATSVTGQRVSPDQWNDLIQDPDVIVIDIRNSYEVAIGTFEDAVDPLTESFSEFPQYISEHLAHDKSKKIAMFCTGGIRCEKASSYMLAQGFENVYQLDGGILKYLETVSQDESLWNGACFVFDGRVSVGHGLKEEDHALCRRCGVPYLPAVPSAADFGARALCGRCKPVGMSQNVSIGAAGRDQTA